MAVRLQFKGIRCFSEGQDAVIRPITLLVGENSSGKTTFLAVCRIAHAIANSLPTGALFNEPPFGLGAYDQIASHPIGRKGRSKSFSIGIAIDAGGRQCSVATEFVSRRGQPSPSVWSLEAGELAIQAHNVDGPQHGPILLSGPRGKNRIGYAGALNFEFVTQSNPTDWAGLAYNEVERAGGLRGKMAFEQSDWGELGGALARIGREFLRRPYAISPVRTNPRRTYDPIAAAPSPEGSHIPMLLATLSRSGRQERWNALRSALKEFGLRSGLFGEIEIVNKGKKESDPFQVGVKSGGRTFNLIDVGYGVSQALPILVDTIQRSDAFETFLLQQPEVHLHPKAQAELGSFFAKQAGTRRRFVIETHSDYLVDRIRMEVRQKVLGPEDVSLLYFERRKSGATIHNLELDFNGSITNPPPGFRQFFLKEERDLLGI